MNPTVACLRRAATAIFVTHVAKSALSAVTTWEVFSVTAEALLRSPQTSAAADGVAIAAALARLRPLLGSEGLSVAAPLIAWLVCTPVWRAWWLRTMGGDAIHTGLARALVLQPALWGLAVLHMSFQGLWGLLCWEGCALIDAQVPTHIHQPSADLLCGSGALVWSAFAFVVWTHFDLVIARHVTDSFGPAGQRRPFAISRQALFYQGHGLAGVARSAARKCLLRVGEIALVLAGVTLSASTWPQQLPLLVLIGHQMLAIAGTALRGSWVAHTFIRARHPD